MFIQDFYLLWFIFNIIISINKKLTYLFCFHSPLLTKSRLIFFKSVTKMFQFTDFYVF